MFAEGQRYRFTWDAGDDDGREYQYYVVLSQQGTVVHVQDKNGREAIINLATPRFIRADPE